MKTVNPFDLNIPASFFEKSETRRRRKLTDVYKTVGFINPILVDKDLNVLRTDDCHRVCIMQEHNADYVIVVFIEELDADDLADETLN